MKQSKQDMRNQSLREQEALRRKVMAEVTAGMSISEASRTYQVSRQSIYTWRQRMDVSGDSGLITRRRGRARKSDAPSARPVKSAEKR